MSKNKELAFTDYVRMIKQSWTYSKLTSEERNNLDTILAKINCYGNIKGSYQDRCNIISVLYSGFLAALGFDKNPVNWRVDNPEILF